MSRASSLGYVVVGCKKLVLERFERGARLLNKSNPSVSTALREHFLWDSAQPAVARIADCALSKLGVPVHGTQDNVAAGNVVNSLRFVYTYASTEEEVDNALFEDVGWSLALTCATFDSAIAVISLGCMAVIVVSSLLLSVVSRGIVLLVVFVTPRLFLSAERPS